MFLAVSRCFSSLMHVQTNASAAPAFLRVEKLSLLPRCSFHALLTRRRRSLLSSPMPQAHGHPFARPITDELLVERAAPSSLSDHAPSALINTTPHHTGTPHSRNTLSCGAILIPLVCLPMLLQQLACADPASSSPPMPQLASKN